MTKILIDLEDSLYEECKVAKLTEENEGILFHLMKCIASGDVLPKGHGDLKDVQDIINRINLNYSNHQSIDAYSLKDMIATTRTIIKADKDGE